MQKDLNMKEKVIDLLKESQMDMLRARHMDQDDFLALVYIFFFSIVKNFEQQPKILIII